MRVTARAPCKRDVRYPDISIKRCLSRTRRGFTLIELVVVVMIIGLVMSLVGARLGTFAYWKEEGFIRRLSETLIFLHHQAMVDQSFFVMQFDFENQTYQVQIFRPEGSGDEAAELALIASDAGNLTLELAAFLSPSLGETQLLTSSGIPSLDEPTEFPGGVKLQDIRTMRGKFLGNEDGQKPYILFSPRGFSEFAVLHFKLSRGNDLTILVNPFTGLTDIYREYKDFEWTYGRDKTEK